MKKLFVILAIALIGIACKKERNCICKTASGSSDTEIKIPKAKKSDQEKACDAYKANAAIYTSCELE